MFSVNTSDRIKLSQKAKQDRIATTFSHLVDAEIPGKTQEEKKKYAVTHIIILIPCDSKSE